MYAKLNMFLMFPLHAAAWTTNLVNNERYSTLTSLALLARGRLGNFESRKKTIQKN